MVLILIIVLLVLISPVAGARLPFVAVRHEAYSEAVPSDEGIHSYFTDFLGSEGNCLDSFIDESPDADSRAAKCESQMKTAEEESRYYTAQGFESNVSWVVKPFSVLSGGVKRITENQLVFLTNYEVVKNESVYPAYVKARTAVVNMETGADEIKYSFDSIKSITLWNETSKLIFNVTDLNEKLEDVYALIRHYELLLEEYELEAPLFAAYRLVVMVSDAHPVISEAITIYVHAKNVTSLTLVIDNATYKLKNQTVEHTKIHRFDMPGVYTIYAEGATINSSTVTSNIVLVNVTKIPTFILLSTKYSALLNERVPVKGLLFDYYDLPLRYADVTVSATENETVRTDGSGRFAFFCTRSSEGYLNVSATYPGNDTYKNSGANASIFFSRFQLSLDLEAEKSEVCINETVNFSGSATGTGITPDYTLPLAIIVSEMEV